MRAVFAVLTLCLAGPADARTRSQAHWGGTDFAISCDTVRAWRAEINAMSAATKAEMARQFRITRKQRRQAYACLRKER